MAARGARFTDALSATHARHCVIFGILLQEMPLGCNEAAARIKIDRSRQPLLFEFSIAVYRSGPWGAWVGWLGRETIDRWRTSLRPESRHIPDRNEARARQSVRSPDSWFAPQRGGAKWLREQSRTSRRGAFTLVELLVVIAIIGILGRAVAAGNSSGAGSRPAHPVRE